MADKLICQQEVSLMARALNAMLSGEEEPGLKIEWVNPTGEPVLIYPNASSAGLTGLRWQAETAMQTFVDTYGPEPAAEFELLEAHQEFERDFQTFSDNHPQLPELSGAQRSLLQKLTAISEDPNPVTQAFCSLDGERYPEPDTEEQGDQRRLQRHLSIQSDTEAGTSSDA